MIEKAQLLMGLERWEEACALWGELRANAPDELAGFIQGGIACRELGDNDTAISLFNQAITLFPDEPVGMIKKGLLLSSLEQWQEASTVWSELRTRFPREPVGFIQGGVACRELGDIDLAMSLFDEAITLFPNGPGGLVHKAHTLMKLKEWDIASVLWSELRERFPDKPAGFIHGGIACRELGDIDTAIHLWIHANNRQTLGLISTSLELISDSDLNDRALCLLMEEQFNGIEPPVLTEKLHDMFYSNKELYHSYISRIRDLTERCKIDYFCMISLGLDDNPDTNYIVDILKGGDIELIKHIFSKYADHEINRNVLASQHLIECVDEPVIKSALENIQSDNRIVRAGGNRRLKIAFCISGQLRGYRRAFKTWAKFNFDKHDVDIYGCVWKRVGRREIERTHIGRVFYKNFSQEFVEYTEGKGPHLISDEFRELYSFFEHSELVDTKHIEGFYNTKKVKVIDDEDYYGESNMFKMHFMIESCWQLIDKPEDYDLVVRIRPDKVLTAFNCSWEDVLETVNKRYLITDEYAMIHPTVGLVIGDQFAVSTTDIMKKYSNTFSNVVNEKGVYSQPQYAGFRPHMSLYLSMLEDSIGICDVSDTIVFGDPVDPDRIENEKLLHLIEKDFHDKPEQKSRFTEAIYRDIEAANENHCS
jgi:hypothetical protein